MVSSKLIQVSINYGGHDTSSALSIGDKIVAAAEQERYDLSKHSRKFPLDALKSCLKKCKLNKMKREKIQRGYLKDRGRNLPTTAPSPPAFVSETYVLTQ